MKKFTFRLDRVLDLRHAQARIEEVKLERLYAERASIDARQRDLREASRQAGDALRGRSEVTGEELAALDAYQRHIQSEGIRGAQARVACGRNIEAQLLVISVKRRDVKLLERLKQQRKDTWAREVEREIGQEAEESHLAKWNRENIQ